MSRDSKMCAAQFAKGMGIGLGVGMAVGAAAGLMMQPQKKRAAGRSNARTRRKCMVSVYFKHGHERLGGKLHTAYLAHALLAFLLFL